MEKVVEKSTAGEVCIKNHNPKIFEKSPAGLEDILKDLNHNGCQLWKIRSPTKRFRRKFFIDLGSMKIKYEPAYKNTCTGRKKHIDIADIQDVRQGWQTDIFNTVEIAEQKKSSSPRFERTEEERCFSIVYGTSKTETLDLIAPSVEIADKWLRALRFVHTWEATREQERSYEIWLRKKFLSADLDKNKCLSFDETLKLLEELNINMDRDQAIKLFNEANTTRGGGDINAEVLDEDEFIAFYFRLLQRPEIEKLFECYAANGVLTADQLCRFLQKEQGGFEKITVQECKELIAIHEQSTLKSKYQMSSSGFVNMLLSPTFELFNQDHKKVFHDMTHPLTHYFIATSHNTYLLGNQLSSASSVEGYVNALKRGCRCVELDIWDGPDDEPIIYHGYTLTSKILLKEVLKDAIKPYAFVKSKFPLILSFENHCTQPYQQKVAEYLREVLGDMIYTEPVSPVMKQLPSPLELQNKIVIKAKKTKGPASGSNTAGISTVTASISKTRYATTSSPVLSKKEETKTVEANNTRTIAIDPPVLSQSSDAVCRESESSESEEEDANDSLAMTRRTTKGGKDAKVTSNDLSSLINILQGAHFHSFQDSKINGKCYHITSFSESKAGKFIEQQGEEFVDYNKRIMTRIYPGGARTGSSNFDPVQFWTAGCQCVALNYQTEDLPNFCNYGWFTENGSCGYVLKPEFLRNPTMPFNPTTPIAKKKPTILKVRIISAQHLPKMEDNPDIVDPYVEIKVFGLEQDSSKHVTQFIHNNGFNPIWDATFELQVRCPELAMLYFCIKDYAQSSSDTPLAYYIIPFSALTTGYRHMHLVNLKGMSLAPSTLFVHVSLS